MTKISGSLRDLNENFEALMKEDWNRFAGLWIAVVDGKLVSSGKEAEEVYEEAEKKFPRKKILFGKIPGKESIVI